MDYVMLAEPAILAVSLVAVIATVAARFVDHKYVSGILHIASFLCVVGCVTYALLLGAELKELLTYILLFVLIGMTSFIPVANEHKAEDKSDAYITENIKIEETGAQTENTQTEGGDEL